VSRTDDVHDIEDEAAVAACVSSRIPVAARPGGAPKLVKAANSPKTDGRR